MSASNAKSKLDKYVTIRGNIAHRTTHNAQVYKSWGSGYLKHVENLVFHTERAVGDHLEKVTSVKPW